MTTPMLPVISRPRRQFASEEETSSSVQLDRRAWRERDNGRRRARSESPPRSERRILEPHEFIHVFIRHGGRADDNGWYQYPVDAVTKGRPWPAELTRRQKEYHDAQDGIKKIKDEYLEEKRNAVKRCQILNLKKTLLTDQLSALEHETLLWKAKAWYLAAKRAADLRFKFLSDYPTAYTSIASTARHVKEANPQDEAAEKVMEPIALHARGAAPFFALDPYDAFDARVLGKRPVAEIAGQLSSTDPQVVARGLASQAKNLRIDEEVEDDRVRGLQDGKDYRHKWNYDA